MKELKQIIDFKEHLNNLKSTCNNLPANLSNANATVSDIKHYIEFNNFNASEGYNLCKKLQIALQARRQIKDQIETYAEIDKLQQKINGFLSNAIFNTQKILAQQKSRTYNVKILTDEYGAKIKKGGDQNEKI